MAYPALPCYYTLLVAYPAPWGVPLELPPLQRVLLPLTFTRILDSVQKSFPQKCRERRVQGDEKIFKHEEYSVAEKSGVFLFLEKWRADGSPWAVASLVPASNYQCSRHRLFTSPETSRRRRRMQKGNAQLVRNPLSASRPLLLLLLSV